MAAPLIKIQNTGGDGGGCDAEVAGPRYGQEVRYSYDHREQQRSAFDNAI